MSRWLRLLFGLLALFGPAAFPLEASARPAVVCVGGGREAPVVVAARSPRRTVELTEWPSVPTVVAAAPGTARPLYLLNRALLR